MNDNPIEPHEVTRFAHYVVTSALSNCRPGSLIPVDAVKLAAFDTVKKYRGSGARPSPYVLRLNALAARLVWRLVRDDLDLGAPSRYRAMKEFAALDRIPAMQCLRNVSDRIDDLSVEYAKMTQRGVRF